MRLRLFALTSVLGLMLFGSLPAADAGVKGNTYGVFGITTSLQFINDSYAFGSDGSTLTANTETGIYNELDLSVIDLWFATLQGSQNYSLSLTGLQIQTFIVAQGTDSNGATIYLFGTLEGSP